MRIRPNPKDETNLVLVVGAGATLAESLAKKSRRLPAPLDANFFKVAKKVSAANAADVVFISQYLGHDIRNYRMEQVFNEVYLDFVRERKQKTSREAYRRLMQVLHRTLAGTTNGLATRRPSPTVEIIESLLTRKTGNLTILTFNYDLVLENGLDLLSRRYKDIWSIGSTYGMTFEKITSPSGLSIKSLFPNSSAGYIKVLKLHGSLNWYHVSKKATPNPFDAFKPSKSTSSELYCSRRRQILAGMTYGIGGVTQQTVPLILPPVSNKTDLVSKKLNPLWASAEVALQRATHVIVHGFSMPPTDFDAIDLFSKTLGRRSERFDLYVIDPSCEPASRFWDCCSPSNLHHYSKYDQFLAQTTILG